MDINAWKKKGSYVTTGKYRLFVIDQGNKPNRETLLLLHGYPTSSYEYYKVLPILTQKYRVVVHDHLGFGFSDKPESYSYSLLEQADYALLLWNRLGIEQAHIVAHDYGCSIATELVTRNELGLCPIKIQSVTLTNGSIHIELARLRFIQKLLKHPFWGPKVVKFTTKNTYTRSLRKLFSTQYQGLNTELEALYALTRRNNGQLVIPKITQYLNERFKFHSRWVGALIRTSLTVYIVWGEADPIAVVEMADVLEEEIRNSHKTVLPDVGHFPALEAPELWANTILKLL